MYKVHRDTKRVIGDDANKIREYAPLPGRIYTAAFRPDGAVFAVGSSLDGKGESCLFEGRVVDLQGNPIAGARVDVWSDNADGFYDVQQPGIQPQHNNRGVFITGADGRYSFVGIKPVSYPIPDDGPVGQMLAHLGRHPYRPAHMHYLVTAPGFEKLVTHTFVGGDTYLTSDAVFGVRESLVTDWLQLANGSYQLDFDFVLNPV